MSNNNVAHYQVLVVRKTSASMTGTVMRTLARVLDPLIKNKKVRVYGGETPSRFIFDFNGSCIWSGGMDNPDSCLSAERDAIYVNQAEELTLNDWEVLTTRCTGRGSVVPYPQIFADCNPSSQFHWILHRHKQGKLRLIETKHEDNPSLFVLSADKTHWEITEQGQRTFKILENLSGVRRDRLLSGKWVTAEGVIFDMFSRQTHVCERDETEMVEWFLAIDEGYSNPAVILLVGSDADRRWHIFREFYRRGVAEIDVVAQAHDWYVEKQCGTAAVDEAGAGLIAACINSGMNAVGGKGRIIDGIYSIQNRLKVVAGDVSPRWPKGRPRLTISEFCPQTINEFQSHVWKTGKDVPVDADNHSISALRYLEDVLGTGTGAFSASSPIFIPGASSGGEGFKPRSSFSARSYTPRHSH
jgi:phage terminase large subunit